MYERYSPYGGVSDGPPGHKAPRDKTPCKYYAQGACDKGAECVWMHVTPATPGPEFALVPRKGGRKAGGGKGGKGNKAPKNQVPCKFLARGRCNNMNCEWMHPQEQQTGGYNQQGNALQQQLLQNMMSNPLLRAQMMGMGMGMGMGGNNEGAMLNMNPMLAIAMGGSGGGGGGGGNAAAGAPLNTSAAPQAPLVPKDQVVCKYYASGQCDKGVTCEWSHPGYDGHDMAPVQKMRPQIPKSETPCKYLASGMCKVGDDCEWSHEV